MKDAINVKLTKQEEKQVKIGQIKADMGGGTKRIQNSSRKNEKWSLEYGVH